MAGIILFALASTIDKGVTKIQAKRADKRARLEAEAAESHTPRSDFPSPPQSPIYDEARSREQLLRQTRSRDQKRRGQGQVVGRSRRGTSQRGGDSGAVGDAGAWDSRAGAMASGGPSLGDHPAFRGGMNSSGGGGHEEPPPPSYEDVVGDTAYYSTASRSATATQTSGAGAMDRTSRGFHQESELRRERSSSSSSRKSLSMLG